MTPAVASAGLGLGSALLWGAGDFSGGLASRRAPATAVVVWGQGSGFILLGALALGAGEARPNAVQIGFAALGGLCGGIGLVCLYQALARGTMSLAAPVSAVVTAVVLAVVGACFEGPPGPLRVVGFLLAAAGIVIVSRPAGGARPEGLGLALAAGLGFGGFLSLLKLAASGGVFGATAVARGSSLAILLIYALRTRVPLRPPSRSLLTWMVGAGALDAAANTLFALAAQRGRLDVAGVVGSLYPASTVLLARIVLGERLTGLQPLGLLCALAAVPLIAV